LDPEFLPQNVLGAFKPVGARATALGGAFVSLADDASGGAWNPAGVALGRGFDLGLSFTGYSDNLNVENIRDFYQDLTDLREDITDQSRQAKAFNTFLNLIEESGGRVVQVGISPLFSLSLGRRLAVNGYGQIDGLLRMTSTRTPVAGTNNETVNISVHAAAVTLGYASVSWAQPFGDNLIVGLSGKYLRADYFPGRFDMEATRDQTTGIVDVATLNHNLDPNSRRNLRSNDTAIAFDVGLLLRNGHTTVGAVVRNLNSPTLTFENPNAGAGTFDVGLDPQLDVGFSLRSEDGRHRVAFEIHNLSASNAAPTKVHFGYEGQYWWRHLTLRFGINGTELVGGLGVNLAGFYLDLTSGTNLREFLACGLRLAF